MGAGSHPPDPYDVLGLRQSDAPSASEIRKAYHRLARIHHPDKADTPEAKERAEATFKTIGAAYELLSDPERRSKFDRDGHDEAALTPAEAEAEERHARRMYCAAMGAPETVVRETWCTLEELFHGATKLEMVLVLFVDEATGAPTKRSMRFTVRVLPGWRDGREVRFGAFGTAALQSVAFVVREKPHPFFTRAPAPSPDVLVWCALTPTQHRDGAVIELPTLGGANGSKVRLRIKPGSAVARTRGAKTIEGEGFPDVEHGDDEGRKNKNGDTIPGGAGSNSTHPRRRRGDMRVHFRVMSRAEAWLRVGERARWARWAAAAGGGYAALWLCGKALLWALDVDGMFADAVPDALLLGEFPGSYGRFGAVAGELFYPAAAVPARLVGEWAPAGLGAVAASLGYVNKAIPRRGP